MMQETPFRQDALEIDLNSFEYSELLENTINETYVREAGWYFKTLAVQEVGK